MQKMERSDLLPRDKELYEKNIAEFNSVLKSLPNASGVYRYETRSNYFVFYDEVHKKFHFLEDFGGYRKYSQAGIIYLKDYQEEIIYHEAGLGLLALWQVPIYFKDVKPVRLFQGELNIFTQRTVAND